MTGRPGLPGLLQITDSAFPVGGFAHSDGIEALAALGVVRDEPTLEAVLVAHRRLTLDRCDAWFVREAHAATARRDGEALRACATGDLTARSAAGTREASLTVGRALLRVGCEIAAAGGPATGGPARPGRARAGATRRAAVINPRDAAAWAAGALGDLTPRPTAFGAVACAAGVTPPDAADAYAFTVLSGMAAAAVRLQLVGPLGAQRALRRALEARAPASPDEDWAAFSPLLDIAAMRHEHLAPRLFAS